MSVARIHYVKHARKNYRRVQKRDDEGNPVVVPVTSKRTGQQKTGRGGRPMTKRVTIIDRSQPLPNDKCRSCGVEIKPGDPYRWYTIGFRSHYKTTLCMKSTCTPRPSQLESSSTASTIMAAQEDASDSLDGLDPDGATTSDVEEIVHQVGEAFREVADQLNEADEAFGGHQATEHYERAQTAESSADELEGWSTSSDEEPDFESCENPLHDEPEDRPDYDADSDEEPEAVIERGDSECESCSDIRQQWFDDLVQDARDAIDSAEMP